MELPEGYKTEEVIIDATRANLKALTLMLPVGILTGVPFYLLWNENLTVGAFKSFTADNEVWMTYGTVIALFVIMAGIVMHEFIHGVTWARFARKGFASIRFGVLWKELTPYCHCREPLRVKHYITGAAMPAVVLGILPSLAALATGNIFVMAFGLFFTVAAAGDFMIIDLLRKENPNDLVQDHPSKIGYFIFRKD